MSEFTGSGRLASSSRVVRLTLLREGAELSLSLQLQEVDSNRAIDLQFHHVSGLRFRGQRTELAELVLLLAEDVSSRGWERIRFEVKDSEEEFISFWCERIERA